MTLIRQKLHTTTPVCHVTLLDRSTMLGQTRYRIFWLLGRLIFDRIVTFIHSIYPSYVQTYTRTGNPLLTYFMAYINST